MVSKQATVFVDYQSRATGFHRGQRVTTVAGAGNSIAGTVLAVWPAIGMCDVQWPQGASRMPVEDLEYDPYDTDPDVDMLMDSVPGGVGTVRVPGGPLPAIEREEMGLRVASIHKLASRYMRGLYWGARDRKFQVSRREIADAVYYCPRCKDVALVKKIYRREEGVPDHMWVCPTPTCYFLIHVSDILNGG